MTNEVEANKTTIDAFFKASEAGEDVMSYLDPGATWWVPDHWELGGTYNREELGRVFAKVFALLDGRPVFKIHAVTAEEDRVAVDCESTGRFKDGTTFGNTYHFLFRLRGGKIVAAKEYLNTAYMSQLLAQQGKKI